MINQITKDNARRGKEDYDIHADLGRLSYMGKGRLELPRLAAHDPKSCPSANSGTPPNTKSLKLLTKSQQGQRDLLTKFLFNRS